MRTAPRSNHLHSRGQRVAGLAAQPGQHRHGQPDIGVYINGTLVGTVQCLLGAGNSSGVAGKDVLADTNFKQAYYDANGNLVLDLPAAATLGIAAPVAVTAAKTITGNVCAADF
jgi:hypothetical protein